MANLELAREIKNMLKGLIKETIAEETKNCFRVYRARVLRLPYNDPNLGRVCQVQIVGDQSVLSIPFSSRVASMRIGDMVLVATLYNSFQNAIVWETYNFRDNDV